MFRRILAILATALRLSPSLRKAFFDTQLHKTLMRILEGLSKTTVSGAGERGSQNERTN